jgi:virulence factor Mce-like protein
VKRPLKAIKQISPFKAGVIGLVVLLVATYAVFTKFANPFASPFTIHAIVPNANQLRPDSLVRIAGVNVGKVTTVTPSCQGYADPTGSKCQAADVTMTIDNNGLPIHKDATFWIRPRIFLEGNFFVELQPGTPEAPVAPNGYVFRIQQTRTTVQFDQLLTSLQSDTRANLQTLLQQYGLAVRQGGPAFNESINYWTPAYKYGSQVTHDALGTQPHDLSGWIDKAGVVNGALSAHPQNLKSLITNLDTTALAFARQQGALSSAVAELPRTLQVALPALNAVETALCTSAAQPAPPNCAPGPLRQFATGLTRALTGPPSLAQTIDASLPFFTQLRLLVSPSELGGLTNDLSFTIPALAKLDAESIPFMKNGVRPASSCQVNVVLPWSRLEIHDPHFNASNGFPPRPVYVEGVNYLPGLAGEGRSFDANGPFIRVLGPGGATTYSMSPDLFGTTLTPILGVEPQTPAPHPSGDGASVPVSRPPLKPNVPCETQPAITQAQLNNAPQGSAPAPIPVDPPSAAGVALARSVGILAARELESQTKQQGLSMRISNQRPKVK